MKSKTTSDFRKLYRKLPVEIRELAKKAYRLWSEDPNHPSLQFKKLKGHPNYYSVRINQSYRVVGAFEQGAIYWFWIGSHADFDDLFS